MSDEERIELINIGVRMGKDHSSPSPQSIEILKKLSEINEKHFERDFLENKNCYDKLVKINVTLWWIFGILIMIFISFLGSNGQ